MTINGTRAIAGVPKAVGQRLRLACRGMVIAASVVSQHIGTAPTTRLREHPPFVQLLEEPPDRFSQRELVGRCVLTTEFSVPADDCRVTGNRN